ncbi:MAG: hypothetical protein KDC44_20565, partial [Phaeodactylibacter sp.]|nr:hypothetical protein [Phaeodactylibacter sp.]
MDVFNILNTLEAHQISLALDGEDLEVNFSQETIPDEVIALLREYKPLLVDYLKDMKATPAYQRIPQATAAASYPLSSAQRRLWLLSQVEEVSRVYHLPFSFRMQGDYDLQVLEKAIYALVERHESLRTVFREDADGDVRQWIIPMAAYAFKVQIRDMTEVPDAQAEIDAFIAADNRHSFDLAQGPLLRVVFFKKGPADFLCYYNMHHIISDGWSMNILVRDVIAFYRAIAGQHAPSLA